jgi:hypothetical protein
MREATAGEGRFDDSASVRPAPLAAALLSAFLATGSALAGTSIGTPIMTTWRNDAQSAFSVVHDDTCDFSALGIDAHWQEANLRGLRLSFGAIASQCRDRGVGSMLSAMVAAGHEIVSHSAAHCDLTQASTTKPPQPDDSCAAEYGTGVPTATFRPKEIADSKAWFENAANVTGASVTFFAFPYDAMDATAITAVRNTPGYLGARGGDRNSPSGTTPAAKTARTVNPASLTTGLPADEEDFKLKFDAFDGGEPGNGGPSVWSTPYEYLDATRDEGGWGIQELHGIQDSSYGTISLIAYQALLDNLVTRQNNREVWVAPPTDVIKYRRTRFHCGPLNVTGSAVIFGGAANADCQSYATNVTVKIPVTSGETMIAAQQGLGAGAKWLPVRAAAPDFFVDAKPTEGDITVVGATAPGVAGAATATFTVGQSGSYSATGSGSRSPEISLSGSLPSGLTFASTTGSPASPASAATISGTPTAATTSPVSVSISATNDVGSSTPLTVAITVNKGSQTITNVTPLGNLEYVAGATIVVSATGGASLQPVTFTASSVPPGACVQDGTNGTTIRVTGLGTCTVTANQAGDANYNVASPVPQSFVIADTGLPETTITSTNPTVTNATSMTFTFTGSDGTGSGVASFECSLDGGAFAACTSGYTTPGPLTSGPHSFAVRALDNAGNRDATPAPFSWTIDLTKPAIAITSSPPITLANQASYVVGGTCSEGGQPVSVQIGSVSAGGTCGTPASGQFVTTGANVASLPQGSVSLSASITDPAGNTESAGATTTKDTTGPTLSIGTLDAITNANKLTYGFAGSCEAGGGSVSYTLTSGISIAGTVNCVTGTYTVSGLDVSSLADSSTVGISVTQQDAVGNSTTTNGSVVKDTVNPSLAIDEPDLINGDNQGGYAVSGTCSENTRTVTVKVGPVGGIGPFTGTGTCGSPAAGLFRATGIVVSRIPSPLPNGNVPISASMTDALGNSATATATAVKDTQPDVLIGSDINPATIGDTVTVTGTLTDYSQVYPPTGSITFRLAGTPVPGCTSVPLVTTGYYALCFFSPTAGGTFAFTAEYSGDGSYDASTSNPLSQVVNGLPQTIAFAPLPDRTIGDAPLALAATATSNLPVTFASTTPAVCTTGGENGATATLIASGTCSILASQAGNATYAAAPSVLQSFSVRKATPSIRLDSDANPALLQQGITFTATIAGTPAPTGTVAFKDGTVVIAGCEAKALVASPGGAYAVCSTATLATGSHPITAAYEGDSFYSAAVSPPLNQLVNVLAQSITFAPLPDRTLGDLPFAVAATASSGLPVTFSSTTPAVCTIGGTNGSLVTLQGAGTCTLAADQAGSAIYGAANQVRQSFAVAKATPTVTLVSDANPAYDGQPVTFTATLAGPRLPTGTVAFKDGAATIAGCEVRTLDAAAAFATCSTSSLALGTHAITVVYAGDAHFTATTSAPLSQVVDAPEELPRLRNISTRARVETGNNVMIGGFVIGGATPKRVLITARGPSLAAYGVTGAMANPFLQLFSGQTGIVANDDWQSNDPAVVAEILATGIAPASPLESALMVTLNPGAYTAIVSDAGGGSGVGIVEVFEMDHPEIQLVNISTRGPVQTGDNVMIGGFIIEGNAPRTVLITARGPSLAPFGIVNALPNPKLEIFSGQVKILENDDWESNANKADIIATGVAPTDPRESALLVTLNPGAYTAIVSGVGGVTGVGIVEVFAR